MENKVKLFGWKRHLDYFLTKIYLSKQKMKEYKIDFYSMLFFDIILLITHMISYFVLGGLIFSILKWNLGDFFLLFCFGLLAWKILWIHTLRHFSSRLLKGDLNIYLIRPMNVYFSTTTEYVNFQNLISGLGLFLMAISYILISETYTNYLLGFGVFIFGTLYLIVFNNFLYSFAFFLKKNEFILDIFMTTDSIVDKYTPKTFESFPVKIIFYLFPMSIGYFMVETLNGRIIEFYYYLHYLLISFFVMVLGIILMWHYGLKKYEAFG